MMNDECKSGIKIRAWPNIAQELYFKIIGIGAQPLCECMLRHFMSTPEMHTFVHPFLLTSLFEAQLRTSCVFFKW